MKTLKNLSFLSIVFCLALIMNGCEGPAGEVGPASTNGTNGTDGADGTDGTNGTDGTDGTDGTNGTNGTDGSDGKDGNANVTVISLKRADLTWTAGNYLGRTSNVFELSVPEVDQDIIDSGTVLGYLFISGFWMPMPFTWETNSGTDRQYILFQYKFELIKLLAYQTSGVLDPGGVSEYRFMLITDNTVTSGGRVSSNESVMDRLNDAGVDINNYEEVCQYFGIDPN